MHLPWMITEFRNVSTVAVTSDFLPTIMELLDVKTDNPTWAMDGMSLLPFIGQDTSLPRPHPLGFSWGGLTAIIDNEWKLLSRPNAGQCDFQEPYASLAKENKLDEYYLFNVVKDYHELFDQKALQPERYKTMLAQRTAFLASIANSQKNETKCSASPVPPAPPAPPSSKCNFIQHAGLESNDAQRDNAHSKEQCCGICIADKLCTAATFSHGACHVKTESPPKIVQGRDAESFVCIPQRYL